MIHLLNEWMKELRSAPDERMHPDERIPFLLDNILRFTLY